MYGSDELAPKNIERCCPSWRIPMHLRGFLDVFEQEHWPNALLSTASELTSPLTGPSGVKMSGPYSWVPPVYWLQDTHRYT
jgi:hypothetical protein